MSENHVPTSELLHAAADAIERTGWSRGNGWDWNAPYQAKGLCLEGGIAAAMGIELVDFSQNQWGSFITPAHNALVECPAYKAVKEYLGYNRELWRWNDNQRTAAPVIETLRAAAEVEYAKEHAYDAVVPGVESEPTVS